jgi:hypothetical protein
LADHLPATLEHFVVSTFRSLAHLDAFWVIHRDPTRWWTCENLASAVGASVTTAEQILEDLCSANLLEVRLASAAVAYRFNPGSPDTEQRIAQLADALRSGRDRVYALVSSPSSRAMRDFADAFRLRARHRG